MEQLEIEKLIRLDEGERLDFKREIDLQSKQGKADFLVEILGLANASVKPAYLVLGIDDKTRKAVGLQKDVTEERLQKLVNDNLNKRLRFSYKVFTVKRKQIGVISIFGHNRPYVLKKDLGYEDKNGRPHIVSDKHVFIRQGSTGAIASPDDVIEMAISPTDDFDNKNESSASQEIVGELNDISTAINQLGGRRESSNSRGRSIEYTFVGIVSGIAMSFLLLTGWQYAQPASLLLPIMISIILSALRFIDFGLLRSIVVGAIVGGIFLVLSLLLDGAFIQHVLANGSLSIVFPLWGSIKGFMGGYIADRLISSGEMSS